ncbi:hypothetical protein MAPG_00741 [Magnaporthiopsis poae ATCC 64411]|uniref:Carboxymethylenebutenolidase n=1 Tax=Magnaporthiopsis poae (strain ATCC 64411 / 73-15) TaxID=644358 RepID=A0A0C4DLU5_MAGP6|nr:hypothetical protein MAPG_00741 [Magnaporthiopsis poae ATCC 64411]
MTADETPVALPSAPLQSIAPNILLQPPLSRRATTLLNPPPSASSGPRKGSAVAQITLRGDDAADATSPDAFHADLRTALDALAALDECEKNGEGGRGRYGVITYVPLPSPPVPAAATSDVVAFVNYSVAPVDSSPGEPSTPILWHAAGDVAKLGTASQHGATTVHAYREALSGFVLPAHANYRGSSATVAHTRTLTFLRPLVGGPFFDLEAIWDEHCFYEFGDRAVAKTMGTMVAEPYVNHIPTITGGIGRDRLTTFYRNHFIHSNPDDTALELVSRTVGVDRVIDEFIFKLTHDRTVDWLVPGIPPTGKPLEIPFTSVVNIRGDRLYHEHISWDQATVLRQLGLLPEYLPFPYQIDGKDPAPGKKFEYRVPVGGVETVRKLADENSVESNEMFSYTFREVDA